MQPDSNSVIQTLLQENANLTLQNAQYKSLVEQYENPAKEEEK